MLPIALAYVQLFHRDTGYYVGRRHILGHWTDLPPDLKILLPLTVVAHLVFIASAARLLLLRQALGSREELGE